MPWPNPKARGHGGPITRVWGDHQPTRGGRHAHLVKRGGLCQRTPVPSGLEGSSRVLWPPSESQCHTW